jgi:hypothetical protein
MMPKTAGDVVVADVVVEQVAHRVDEDPARLRPAQRLVKESGALVGEEARAAGARVAVELVVPPSPWP